MKRRTWDPQFDDQLEDLSETALKAESAALKDFRTTLAAVDPATHARQCPRSRPVDAQPDARVLAIDTIRMWTKDPDTYSGDVTNAAYVIMKRNYAPAPIV